MIVGNFLSSLMR